MPTIKYIELDGTEHDVKAKAGYSLMVAAVQNGVPGIDGECGGKCSCGTCHVFIDQKWQSIVGQPNKLERKLLELIPTVEGNSRLACQIEINDEIDGLEVRMPEYQF